MLQLDRLEELRKEKYVDRKSFAEAIGISDRSYLRYLKGEISPNVDLALKMALTLGTTVAYLVGETKEPKRVVLVAGLSGNRKANIDALREGVDPELVKKAVAFLAGLSND